MEAEQSRKRRRYSRELKAQILAECDAPWRGSGQDRDGSMNANILYGWRKLTALLLTAVRPGEVANANVADFNATKGTLKLDGKTGERTVTLSTAAIKLFTEQAKNKLPGAPLLVDAFGNRWSKDSSKMLAPK